MDIRILGLNDLSLEKGHERFSNGLNLLERYRKIIKELGSIF